ncbi:MAG: 2Fe-2S iron-sulfur cluster binding domain-containing protein [Bacteriovorax sp.]|nr:2Fe-2S iron-sulfur cluster binding domain-containing protein [Bacteriovorax sp.]
MKKIRLFPSLKEVSYHDGESVLSCLEKNGYALPSNCRAGACGECKIKIREGVIDQGFILDMALSQSDRDQGYALMCMAKVKSDLLEIEWADAEARPKLFPPVENALYMLTEKISLTKKIQKIRLRALGTPLRFWPGQYIQLGSVEKKIPYKSYSIANIPNQDGEIILYISRNNEGVTSKWIHDELNIGEKIKIHGAYGTFIGDPSAETPVLCLAQGSGLAPITSLAMAALLRGGFRNPATILFSAKTNEDLFEKGIFSFLESKFRNFRFRVTLTREQNPGLLVGRIPMILPSLYPNLSNYSLYIAGSPEFVADCVASCKKLGARDQCIHTEGFYNQDRVNGTI